MKSTFLRRTLALAVLAALPLAASAAADGRAGAVATAAFNPRAIAWTPAIEYRSATLRVTGPGGLVLDRDIGEGRLAFDLDAMPFLADGSYTYELALGRVPSAPLAKAMARTQVGEDGTLGDSRLAGQVEALRATVSGTFTIAGGAIVSPYLVEPRARAKDAVVADDQIVQGSLCVGFDCILNEAFGSTTIMLKENNLRILFNDTSVGAFSANKWAIRANDSASGGASYLGFADLGAAGTDVNAGTLSFLVTAGAPANSLKVDGTGRIGLRTATPVLDVHANTSNTPGIRLEQNNGGGFTAQSWDIAANEANFFIRDVTNGGRLPFRIRPGAPSNSIDIHSSGNVGIGTSITNIFDGAARAVTVKTPGNGFSALELQGSQGANGAVGVIRFYNDIALLGQISSVRDGADTSGSLRFLTMNTGAISEKMRVTPDGRVGIGTQAPTDTLHVVGNARVAGNLFVSGSIGPDFVFDPSYPLPTIEQNAAYMWQNRHLPAVGAAKVAEDGQGVMDVYAHTNGILEELEKAHIYIDKLNAEIKALKAEAAARDAALRSELASIRRALAK